jgi:hypothetical protein
MPPDKTVVKTEPTEPQSAIRRRGSRGIVRHLVAMGIGVAVGVAATLSWQSYAETTKQIIATKAPALGWSPETKQMIASWVERLGWSKPTTGHETTPVRPSVPGTPQSIPEASSDQAAQNQPDDAQTISPNSLSHNEVRQVQVIGVRFRS